MEVDSDVFLRSENFAWQDFHGNVVHFIIKLGDEPYWEIGAKLRIEWITVETVALEGLIFIQVIPDLVISILAAHLHTELHLKLLSQVFELISQLMRHESIDKNFLIQLLHFFNASVPDGCLAILVKWLARHRIVKHILELLVRDRVDLVSLAFIVCFRILTGKLLVQMIHRTTVDVSLVVYQHVRCKSCQDQSSGQKDRNSDDKTVDLARWKHAWHRV